MAATASLLRNPLSHLLPRPRMGQNVKLTASDGIETERIWVEVRLASLDARGQPFAYLGFVRSMSYGVSNLDYGQRIIFGPEHIQEILGWSMF